MSLIIKKFLYSTEYVEDYFYICVFEQFCDPLDFFIEVCESEPYPFIAILFYCVAVVSGHAVAQLVEALCYKPEGCKFNS
jgi:hypothetical protein